MHKYRNSKLHFLHFKSNGPQQYHVGLQRWHFQLQTSVYLCILKLWLLIWEEITCEPYAVSQESQKLIAPMSDWHVFATLWLRLLIWVEIKHWTTKHKITTKRPNTVGSEKPAQEAKIKLEHKRLIMRWKIIADNGIVKFMQFPETKEATTGEGVGAARSNDEKFCRRFYLLSGMLSMLTLPNKQYQSSHVWLVLVFEAWQTYDNSSRV